MLGERLQPKLLLTVLKEQSEVLLDAGDPFKDLQEQLDKLAVYNPEFFPKGTTAHDIVSVGDSLTSTEPLMTEPKMTQMVFLMNQFAHNVRQALGVLREYMLFSDNGEFIHKCLNEISVLVENELSAKLRQAYMRNFFE